MLSEASSAKFRQFSYIFPRRFGVNFSQSGGRIHLFGAPKVGKTCIALNYAKSFKNPFYIDFCDIRNSIDDIKNALLKISMEKKVDILILDNFPLDFTLPNVRQIITIGELPNPDTSVISRPILPLSFEEFIGFDNSNQEITQLLDSFLKHGNLPPMLYIKDSFKISHKQEMLLNIFKDELPLFSLIASFQGRAISINQIYLSAKKKCKISKDKLYGFIKSLENRGIIHLVPHIETTEKALMNVENGANLLESSEKIKLNLLNIKPKLTQKSLPKKLFLWDFSLKNAISYEKNLMAVLENMLFLELLGENKPIFYSDKINLICGENGYILAPFKTLESIRENLQAIAKSDLNFCGLNIIVITFELEGEININGTKILIRNFINFALDEIF
ncbi:hypothetical protein CCY99_04580 [Helicobacter sp. 16-1353]|uniref:ATP-binding protein n=1 Tax=Helicobacter sp. 16-1353 TaxID=2004996 RepID=UPI000DCF2A43|nr:ATP-binding protein [Helicobacter sp. 16-1353]RAX54292.1 hypothetical protein CCY99_04580 [Helicobacter sp. 16-1353]